MFASNVGYYFTAAILSWISRRIPSALKALTQISKSWLMMLIKRPTLWRPPINPGFTTDWRTFRAGSLLVFMSSFFFFFGHLCFFRVAHIFTAVQYGSECSVTIHIIYNPQGVFQSSMKVQATNTHYRHGASSCRLALCEKALAEYLDTKRLAFPRFYFISSADLLDILSNGTNPQQVTHTPALYTSFTCSLISACFL